MKNFVHLKVKSDYSLSKSTIKVKQIASLAQGFSMDSVGICDENLFGALEFSNYCTEKKIQPILSAEFDFNFILNAKSEKNNSFDNIKNQNIDFKLTLIVKNQIGYKNILYIHKEIANYIQIQKKIPLFSDILTSHSDGLMCLISYSCGFVRKIFEIENGNIFSKFNNNDLLKEYANNNFEINSILKELLKIFCSNNRDDLYFEISRHGYDFEKIIEPLIFIYSDKYNIPIVAVCDIFFPRKESHKAHDALLCIKEGEYVSSENRLKFNDSHFFMNKEEMNELFADIDFALVNSYLISKKVSFCPRNNKPKLPKFGLDENKELENLSYIGLEKKLINFNVEKKKIYEDRLIFELKTICNMGFAGYFLIVADFILWAKNNNIYVGPGRGSAAGSLVAWVLGITDVDPILFGLLFERFLNPDRISMPDIDIDFCPKGRDRVIKYIKEKYGYDNVANIIAFGGMQARGVLRDVGRVLGMPYSKVDAICRMIPFNPANPITLAEAIDLDHSLKAQSEEDESIKNLLDISLELEGILRNQSTHAAGIVISYEPLSQIIPVWFDSNNGDLITGFHMKPLEACGLVKFDFLGLSTLTLIQDTIDLIYHRRSFTIKLDEISLSDNQTYEMLSTGRAVGVFQLESGIMRDGLKKIKPERIEDIIALVSLNRPGPMENVPEYILRKFGLKEIDYLHPLLKDLLSETFGIIVYQEQVMEIAKILAGYSLAEADLLRRAMGKKIKEEMDKQKEFFVNGAMKNNIDPKTADYIFDLVAKFAGYGFNKSHATAYAIISYYTAWLKTHYKIEFFVAILNLEINNTDKIALLKADSSIHGVNILGPCVLRSDIYFKAEDNESIRYGLYAIKNVGEFVSKSIFDSRIEKGEFLDLFDFLKRFNNKVLNKKSLESLVKSGALDILISKANYKFSLNKASILGSVLNLIDFVNKTYESIDQPSLFLEELNYSESFLPDILEKDELSEYELSTAEFEALGFYLNYNPVNIYKNFLKKNNCISCSDSEFIGANQNVYISGAITNIHIRSSKKGKFANLTIMDNSGISELFIYDSKIIEDNSVVLKSGNLVFLYIKGLVDKNATINSSVRLIVTELYDLRKIAVISKSIFEIEFSNILVDEDNNDFLVEINSLLKIFGKFKKISDFFEGGGSIFFPNFNTYYILRFFSIKYNHIIEIKPKLVFEDFNDLAYIETNLKKINGFINIKRVY